MLYTSVYYKLVIYYATRGWRNTVGGLESVWLKKAYDGPQFADRCINNKGVRFHRIRDFKQYYFNSVLPNLSG